MKNWGNYGNGKVLESISERGRVPFPTSGNVRATCAHLWGMVFINRPDYFHLTERTRFYGE